MIHPYLFAAALVAVVIQWPGTGAAQKSQGPSVLRASAFFLEKGPVGPARASVYLSPEDLQEPAPAFKALAEDCRSVALATLEGENLTAFLRTISEPCVQRTFSFNENRSLWDYGPTVYSDRNLQSVLAEIEELSVTYDGTNSAGMLPLWLFVLFAYTYERIWPEITGVGPFDEETDRAYLAASDAFAASDHFYDPKDETAKILYYYFETAYVAGFRQNHLAPIKQVLSGFNAERAGTATPAWGWQPWAFLTVLSKVRDAFLENDQDFIDAISQDAEFIEVMLQVTRYDFFFYVSETDLSNTRIGYLNGVIDILVRLTRVESSRETAITALETVLSEQDRLSSPFLWAARGLEDQVDCESLNICREVLEGELLARAVPDSYRFDEGALVFRTSLDLDEVLPLYHGTKAVQAQFHRLVGTDDPVGDGADVFTARIYENRLDYQAFESYLTGADTWGIHGGGFYISGVMSSWIRNRPGDATHYGGGIFEEVVRHEYAHYLADRFGLLSFGGPWFDEGLAEFLVGSTQAEGVLVRRWPVNHISGSEVHLDPAGLFEFSYSADQEGRVLYPYAGFFFHFLHRERRSELLELFDLVRSGNSGAYSEWIESWRQDARVAADFKAFLDEQVSRLDQHADLVSTQFTPRDSLTIDSVDEIESALHQIDGLLDLSCQSVDSKLSPRFRCSGRLAAESGFTGDRGKLSEHLNVRLDAIINAALASEEINNFQDMHCYFADVTGSPPVADLSCDGPLRPTRYPAGLSRLAGNGQEQATGLPLENPLVVEVTDQYGDFFEGAQVSFSLMAGDDVFSVTTDTTDTTGADGRASTALTLGPDPGRNTVVARVPELKPVIFSATGLAIPGTLTRVSGGDQQGTAGAALIEPFVVEVRDQNNEPLEGAAVSFTITAGDGMLSAATASTDANGQAATILTLGREPETVTVTATVSGLDPLTFTATAKATPDFDDDGETGFSDFFLFADAFGGSDPRFDLDGSGSVDFADFFLLADHFGNPARGKLMALAREMIGLPAGPQLQQNAPNPFNSQTVISWFLLRPGPARVEVFALTGQRVSVLHQGPRKAGSHRVHWDGRDDNGRSLASGVYLYRLVTGERVQARKLTLLR